MSLDLDIRNTSWLGGSVCDRSFSRGQHSKDPWRERHNKQPKVYTKKKGLKDPYG